MSKENVYNLAEQVLTSLVNGNQTPYTVVSLYETPGRNAVKLLADNGLIRFRSHDLQSNSMADVTILGEEAYNIGLHKYLSDIETREHQRKHLEFKKLNIDVKNSERVFSTYWYTFSMSIIALIISAVLLILKLTE